jgi:hypothetical protein
MQQDSSDLTAGGRLHLNAGKRARGHQAEDPIYFGLKLLAESRESPLIPSNRLSNLVEGRVVKPDGRAHLYLRGSVSCFLATSHSIS